MADLQPAAQSATVDTTAETATALEKASASTPMTSVQADQILAELKTIKQNLLWVLLLGGFFTARAFFFHF